MSAVSTTVVLNTECLNWMVWYSIPIICSYEYSIYIQKAREYFPTFLPWRNRKNYFLYSEKPLPMKMKTSRQLVAHKRLHQYCQVPDKNVEIFHGIHSTISHRTLAGKHRSKGYNSKNLMPVSYFSQSNTTVCFYVLEYSVRRAACFRKWFCHHQINF